MRVFAVLAALCGMAHGKRFAPRLTPRGAVGMALKLPPAIDVGGGALKNPAPAASGPDLQQLGKSALRTIAPLALAATPLVLYASPAAAAVGISAAEPFVSNLLDSAFFQALSLIFVSELGDKTFFIATILAARTSRLLTFVGAAGALAAMTVLSVLIGQIFHAVPTGLTRGLPIDDIIAVISFSYFGIKSLLDASALEDGDNSGMEEEAEEAEKELNSVGKAGKWALIGEAFALTFAAELGDRSQLTTIALSAAQNPFAVCIGAIIAHCIATGGAVLGGSFISKYLSEKVIGYIGGGLFIVFAATTMVGLVPQLVALAA